MANNVRAQLEFCKSWGDKHMHRIVNCMEELTVLLIKYIFLEIW